MCWQNPDSHSSFLEKFRRFFGKIFYSTFGAFSEPQNDAYPYPPLGIMEVKTKYINGASNFKRLHFSWSVSTLKQSSGVKWITSALFISSGSDPDSFFTDPGFFSQSGSRQQKTNFFKAKTKFWETFLFSTQKVGILFLFSTN